MSKEKGREKCDAIENENESASMGQNRARNTIETKTEWLEMRRVIAAFLHP